MMISTRGRYALRVLVDLAEHSGSFVPMKDVAARQGISKKYMEQIMALLVKDGYVEGVHGKGGGYRLGRPPEQCVVGDILRLTEGSLAPVACLSCKEPRPFGTRLPLFGFHQISYCYTVEVFVRYLFESAPHADCAAAVRALARLFA